MLPHVGSYLHPNTERILALSPDLVLADDTQEKAAITLSAAGIRVLRLSLRSLNDVRKAIRDVGQLAGVDGEARRLLAAIEQSLARAPKLIGRPRVLLVIGRDPGTLRNIYAAGPKSYAGELLALAGGQNVLSEQGTSYPRLSIEGIVGLDPEVVLEVVDSRVDLALARADWNALSTLSAVRDGRVYVTHEELLTTPGPRAAQALGELVRTIQSL